MIKRMVAFVLGLLMCITTFEAIAFAETPIDISSMSTEELLSLREQITSHLLDTKGIVELPAGDYIVGQDIAPGSYTISLLNHFGNYDSLDITVFNSAEARASYSSALENYNACLQLYAELLDTNPSEQPFTPEPIDGSKYYSTHFSERSYNSYSVHVSLSDGQVLSVKYSIDMFYGIIEKATGLFMKE